MKLLQGRVACELSASDEILLTEMLYGGVFNNMNPAEIGALLSCFVFQENAQTRMDDTTSGFLRTLHVKDLNPNIFYLKKLTFETKKP